MPEAGTNIKRRNRKLEKHGFSIIDRRFSQSLPLFPSFSNEDITIRINYELTLRAEVALGLELSSREANLSLT